jgi:PAS domain S-box-containing protein
MLKSRTTLAVILVGVAALIVNWTAFLSLAADERRDIRQASEAQARQASIYFKESVTTAFRYADSYTKAFRKEYLENGEKLEPPKQFIALFPFDPEIVSHLTIMDANGTPLYNTGTPVIPGRNAADRDYFQETRDTLEDVPHVSMALRGRLTGKAVLRVIRRITRPDGSFGGIVFTALEGERIVELVKSLSLGAASSGTLVGMDKLVRARFSGGRFDFGQDISRSPMWEMLQTSASGHYLQTSAVDGVLRHYYYHKIEGFPLVGIIGVAESDLTLRKTASDRSHYLIAATITLLILVMVFFTLRQFAARRKLEQATDALRQREGQLRLITDTMPAEINYTDRDNIIRFANRAYAERHGFRNPRDIIGRSRAEVWGSDDHADILPGIEETLQGKITQIERQRILDDGTARTVLFTRAPQRDASGAVIGYVSIGQDISDSKNMEAALAQAQKMEAIGQLTGGVAHDFNNLLAVIMGNAELISDLGTGNETEAATILRAAKRGAELTQRLLAFSRRQTLQPRAVDLPMLMQGTVNLLRRTLGETIEIRTHTRGTLPPVMVDPGQLENALLNLAINSRDAMPRGGVLSIELSRQILDDSFGELNDQVSPGTYVLIEVSDNGCGMTEEVRKRAIEPFFTTKDVGKGSGLGLPMVYGFAHQSNGHMTIYSEPGIGTTIKLYLPVANVESEKLETREAPNSAPFGKRERVLLVEDDPEVLRLVSSILKTLDYIVVTAPDAATALARLEQGERIDLLLSDVVLPGGVSGPDLAKTTVQRWPDIKVLFVSGYPANIAGPHAATDLGDRLLSKPFTRTALALKLREILDA